MYIVLCDDNTKLGKLELIKQGTIYSDEPTRYHVKLDGYYRHTLELGQLDQAIEAYLEMLEGSQV